MVTIWKIVIINRFGRQQTFREVLGDKITQEELKDYYANQPTVIKVKTVKRLE